MDAVNCFAVLHMHIATTADACAAARAAIRAAEIQAKATRSAGGQSVFAGALALIAGTLAFGAAIAESIRLRRIEAAGRKAYSLQILALVTSLRRDLPELESYAARTMDWLDNEMPAAGSIPIIEDTAIDTLTACCLSLGRDRWSEIGNLPEQVMGKGLLIGVGANGALRHIDVVRSESIKMHSIWRDASQTGIDIIFAKKTDVIQRCKAVGAVCAQLKRHSSDLIHEVCIVHGLKEN